MPFILSPMAHAILSPLGFLSGISTGVFFTDGFYSDLFL